MAWAKKNSTGVPELNSSFLAGIAYHGTFGDKIRVESAFSVIRCINTVFISKTGEKPGRAR